MIADHVTEDGVEILAWSLARAFLAQEHEANRDHPGVMLRQTAGFERVETLGSGVNELMGMDRHKGVAVAGEMMSVIANGRQQSRRPLYGESEPARSRCA